jgi:hypothetical protein
VRPLLKESVALGEAVACVKYINIHNVFLSDTYFVVASHSEYKGVSCIYN